jgi:hypothetical protein
LPILWPKPRVRYVPKSHNALISKV